MANRAHAMIVHMGMRRNAEFTPKDEALLAANSPSLLLHENAHDRYAQYFLVSRSHTNVYIELPHALRILD